MSSVKPWTAVVVYPDDTSRVEIVYVKAHGPNTAKKYAFNLVKKDCGFAGHVVALFEGWHEKVLCGSERKNKPKD